MRELFRYYDGIDQGWIEFYLVLARKDGTVVKRPLYPPSLSWFFQDQFRWRNFSFRRINRKKALMEVRAR